MIDCRMLELLTVVAEVQAKPGKEEELRTTLMELIGPTRREDGCVQYDLHVHTSVPGRFVFYENWTSPEALARRVGPFESARGKAAELGNRPGACGNLHSHCVTRG